MSDFTRYIVPNGGGVTEHPSGRLYLRQDVDPVVDALRARIRELEAENKALREALEFYADADQCDATVDHQCTYTGNLCCQTARNALVAAPYERAAKFAGKRDHADGEEPTEFDIGYDQACDDNASVIRGLTPADAQAARDARDKRVREQALREAAALINRKIKAVQPEMSRRAQRLSEGKKPGFQYAIHRADLDARMSDRDTILALIEKDQTNE